jgi:cellobiose phosphorylase
MAFASLGDSARAWELLDLINPVMHGSTPNQVAIYRVEPYIVAADICALPPNAGRGGWTWYTGASGWMYRLILESLLGITLEVDRLRFQPCIPDDWKSFKVHYHYRETFYHITVMRIGSAEEVTVDGIIQTDGTVHLVDDKKEHLVEVRIS